MKIDLKNPMQEGMNGVLHITEVEPELYEVYLSAGRQAATLTDRKSLITMRDELVDMLDKLQQEDELKRQATLYDHFDEPFDSHPDDVIEHNRKVQHYIKTGELPHEQSK
jgi:hypothetical protein